MNWVQDNLPLVIALAIMGWMIWGRVIKPKMLGIKKMTAGAYPDFNEAHTLVDVRSTGEWRGGHPSNAIHIPLNEIEQKVHKIPLDKPVVLICAAGMRSAMAASIVAKAGHADVYNFAGGMGSWCAAQLPTTK